jgi:hypothetical protein
MSYEYGLGAMVGPTSCPANQRLARNLTAGTSRCVSLCSSYQCPPGKRKETLTAYSAGAAQITTTTSRRQQMTSRGCVRVPVADCVPDSLMINSAGVETYCCPDPDVQWRAQHELDLVRRRANRTTAPAGSTCGDGMVTKSLTSYECPPSVSCSTQLPPPPGCVSTGQWYDDNSYEACCPTSPPTVTTPPPGASFYSQEPCPAGFYKVLEGTRSEQCVPTQPSTGTPEIPGTFIIHTGGTNLRFKTWWAWAAAGIAGVGLFLVLRKK